MRSYKLLFLLLIMTAVSYGQSSNTDPGATRKAPSYHSVELSDDDTSTILPPLSGKWLWPILTLDIGAGASLIKHQTSILFLRSVRYSPTIAPHLGFGLQLHSKYLDPLAISVKGYGAGFDQEGIATDIQDPKLENGVVLSRSYYAWELGLLYQWPRGDRRRRKLYVGAAFASCHLEQGLTRWTRKVRYAETLASEEYGSHYTIEYCLPLKLGCRTRKFMYELEYARYFPKQRIQGLSHSVNIMSLSIGYIFLRE